MLTGSILSNAKVSSCITSCNYVESNEFFPNHIVYAY